MVIYTVILHLGAWDLQINKHILLTKIEGNMLLQNYGVTAFLRVLYFTGSVKYNILKIF